MLCSFSKVASAGLLALALATGPANAQSDDFMRQSEEWSQREREDRQFQESMRREMQSLPRDDRAQPLDRARLPERALPCWTMTAGQIIPNTNLQVSHSGDWCQNPNGSWYLRTPR